MMVFAIYQKDIDCVLFIDLVLQNRKARNRKLCQLFMPKISCSLSVVNVCFISGAVDILEF